MLEPSATLCCDPENDNPQFLRVLGTGSRTFRFAKEPLIIELEAELTARKDKLSVPSEMPSHKVNITASVVVEFAGMVI